MPASGDVMPMTVALNNVVNTSTGVVEYNVNMAAAMIAALPTLLVYMRRRPLLRARPDGGRRQRIIRWLFWKSIGLRKRFGQVEILKGIDLDLEKGGFLVLVGPSGCGKSTLLNTIAGLETITSGEIRVDGRAINDLHPSKRDIAMVFQSYALYPNMTVAGNISFGMEMRGVPSDERQKAIDKVAKVLQIGHLLQRKPSQLSGGQRQRVAMGRALVRDPKLFLFDEPLSNLDAKLRVDMRIEIKRLHADHRHHHRLCHPRPDRGDDAGDQDRRHAGRRGAAVRHAGRDLQQPDQPLRRRLHGLAGHEPDPGDDRRQRQRAVASCSQREAREPICAADGRCAGGPVGISRASRSSSASAPRR